jgi:hypothetical protein
MISSYGPGAAGSSAVFGRLIARFQRKYQAVRERLFCRGFGASWLGNFRAAAAKIGRLRIEGGLKEFLMDPLRRRQNGAAIRRALADGRKLILLVRIARALGSTHKRASAS